MEARTTFFIHLHKCGGTTLNAALENMFGKEVVYQIDGRRYEDSAEEFSSLSPAAKQKYQLVKGHMFYGLHQQVQKEYCYITMLREPKIRMVSLYNYVFRTPVLESYGKVTYENPSFVEFVKKGYVRTADNGMTRFISGISWNEIPYGKTNDKVLEEAMRHLEKFLAVGLNEEFDRSLLLFKILLNQNNFPFYQILNKTSELSTKNKTAKGILKISEIHEDEWAEIDPYIKYDMALYQFAKSIFQRQVSENTEILEDLLQKFERQQIWYKSKISLQRKFLKTKKAFKGIFIKQHAEN